MVDKTLLSRKISRLNEYITDLQEAHDITWKRYQSRKRDKAFVERYIHLAIEEVFDISNHLISFHGWREPETFRDIFTVLLENKVIKKKELENYQNMASFRNILVHHYEKVDEKVVFSIFSKKLCDFLQFSNAIERIFLRKKG